MADKKPKKEGTEVVQKKSDKPGKTDKKGKSEDHTQEKVPVRFVDFYKNEVVPVLKKKHSYKNIFQVPKLDKICINVGAGFATQDPKVVEVIAKDIEEITGQKPVITKAKKSVSNFKLREGMKIGCKVTLRQAKMYEFMDKLINLTLPRIRDFKGIPDKSFDNNGNFTMGIKEHIIFPEINIDKVTKTFGMDVTFVTTAPTNEEAYDLLKAFGMPFIKRETAQAN